MPSSIQGQEKELTEINLETDEELLSEAVVELDGTDGYHPLNELPLQDSPGSGLASSDGSTLLGLLGRTVNASALAGTSDDKPNRNAVTGSLYAFARAWTQTSEMQMTVGEFANSEQTLAGSQTKIGGAETEQHDGQQGAGDQEKSIVVNAPVQPLQLVVASKPEELLFRRKVTGRSSGKSTTLTSLRKSLAFWARQCRSRHSIRWIQKKKQRADQINQIRSLIIARKAAIHGGAVPAGFKVPKVVNGALVQINDENGGGTGDAVVQSQDRSATQG